MAHLGPPEGRSPALQEGLAIKAVRIRAVERGFLTNRAEMGIDGDSERGRVWFKTLEDGGACYRDLQANQQLLLELVCTGELIQGWDEDFAALCIETIDEANLREKETQAASQRVLVSCCFRGT